MTEPTELSLQQLISVLGRECGLTAREIAEAVWLALQASGEAEWNVIDVETQNIETNSTDTADKPLPETNSSTEVQDSEPEGDILPAPSSSQPLPSLPPNYTPFPVPNPPAIPRPLEIARELRPLARPVRIGTTEAVDEVATVEFIAETGIWQPILRPKAELWLDMAFIFDTSPSMALWQQFGTDLWQIFSRYGEFRDARIWRLQYGSTGPVLLAAHNGNVHPPNELLTGGRRRAVAIVSDCVAMPWHDGRMQKLINIWSARLPTVVVQVFPERLWSRTALARAAAVEFQNQQVANFDDVPRPSNALKPHVLSDWDSDRVKDGLRLPVLTIEPDSVSDWVRVVLGDRRARVTGVVWDASPTSLEQSPVLETVGTPGDPLDTFLLTASPTARELAGLLASAPVITLPIVRLVQRSLLPRSTAVHVAEVLMSGLLETGDSQAPTYEDAENVVYRLCGEAMRQRLQAGTPEIDSLIVLERVSQYVAKGLGRSISEFKALLRVPGQGSSATEGEFLNAFARVTARILQGLGTKYAAIAEQMSLPVDEPEIAEGNDDDFTFDELEYEVAEFIEFPALKEFEFEPAKIVDIQERFEFETAKVSYEDVTIRGGFLGIGRQTERQWVIQRGRRSAWGFTEHLDEGVALDMMAIPGGTFEMGSPKNEPEHFDDEGPQHEVAVGDFYMGRYAVTQAQWRWVAGLPQVERELNPDPSNFKGDNLPVEQVSWEDAREFCRRLSAAAERTYRLPSEAEWEYACRAGTTTPFHFGEMITLELANYDGSSYNDGPTGESRGQTVDVGTYPANDFGLYEMHGNVWEWCEDDWHGNYKDAPIDGSPWVESDREKTNPECFAAVPGTTVRAPAGLLLATPTRATSAATISVFVFVAIPRGLSALNS